MEGGDYSCAVVLNCRSGNQAAIWWGMCPPDELAVEVERLGLWYNKAFVGVEANGTGLVVCRALQECAYPALYRRRSVDKASRSILQQLGWMTTKSSKQVAVGEANADVRSGAVLLHCPDLVREIGSFVFVGNSGRMQGEPHDDRVMAFCIANQMRRYSLLHPSEVVEPPERWTPEWFKEAARLQSRSREALRQNLVVGAAKGSNLSILTRNVRS